MVPGRTFRTFDLRPPNVRNVQPAPCDVYTRIAPTSRRQLAQGLTQAGEGAPDPGAGCPSAERYCEALADCGLSLTLLHADPRHPDATFVEDTALSPRGAILTRPGAPESRAKSPRWRRRCRGFPLAAADPAPGTVDGGDVCEADDHFLIGVSSRTNEDGARRSPISSRTSAVARLVDIRRLERFLHLKSGIAYLGEGRLLATPDLPRVAALGAYEVVEVPDDERYAANALRVNERVLVADGYPQTRAAIESLGFEVIALDMSEFRKLDGGLSCLSLRWQ